jgi:hypothetical protein
VEGRAPKPLMPLSSIREPAGLVLFKGFRSVIYFQGGLFMKKNFLKGSNCVIYTQTHPNGNLERSSPVGLVDDEVAA